MAHREETAARVRRALAGHPAVVEKRMVGGLSFVVNGSLCCGLTGSALMVRVGADGYEAALREAHTRPMEFAARPLLGYVCVDPEGYRTDTALAAWVARGLAFVSTLPAPTSSPKRRRKASSKPPREDG